MAAFSVNVTDPPYNAVGDGVADDTAAIQAAIDAVLPNGVGGMVVFPAGIYSVTNLTIAKGYFDNGGLQLRGADFFNTIIRRRNNSPGVMLDIQAYSVQLNDLRFEDTAWNGTNDTSSLVRYSARNEFEVDRCWFYSGITNLECYSGDQARISGCIFEGSRTHGLLLYGFSNTRIIGNVFYRAGDNRAAYLSNATGALKIVTIAGHDRPANFAIVGNYFVQSQVAHHIQATTANGLAVTGNFFNLAGIFNDGAYDDVNLVDCERVAISGNVSTGHGDLPDLGPVTRVTRYVVNIAESCRHVRIGDNSFHPGMSGTILDQAPDTYIAASIDGNGPRKTLNASVSWTPPLLNPGGATFTTVTVPGARVSDHVSVTWEPMGPGALMLTGNVSANDTVNVVLLNASPYAYLQGTGNLRVTVWKN